VTAQRAASQSVQRVFERRAARALELAATPGSAQEALRFAAGLNQAQGALAAAIEAAHARRPLEGRLGTDFPGLEAGLADVLCFLAEHGPAALAHEVATAGPSAVRDRLLSFWETGHSGRQDYLARAVLRPYAEVLARLGVKPERPAAPGACAFCSGMPWIAARRPVPESDGAERVLACALCGGDWPLARISCPACGEQDPARLPSFTSAAYAGARIEACESCRRYVKSIDLTDDARRIPEVDDLVSLGLDLWAAEQGFERIEPGLAGL